jgi:hypothetical protein
MDGSPLLPENDAQAGRAQSPRFVVEAPGVVTRLTGVGSPSRTAERWNITCADLGFTFEHNGNTYIVFGDTWGRAGVEKADWRSNTMAVIEPDATHSYLLTDVISGDNGEAKELLPSLKQPGTEFTVAPSSGIAVGDRMYLHYMSVRDWREEWWGYKHPIVNGAGFAYSDDYGQTWVKDETARWEGDSAFTQVGLVEGGDHVYAFGTPAGRFGPAKLMRVPAEHILEPSRYEYWTGASWSTAAANAADVVPAPVGELSVRWSEYHQRWLMMYLNEVTHAIVLRTAEGLTGPWDEERTVVTAAEYRALYAPFMLPRITGPDIYFTMSTFFPDYNVFLMRFTLESQRELSPFAGGSQANEASP